jgi:hypothetical protein
MHRQSERCPICGKENFAMLQVVEQGKPCQQFSCDHLRWSPLRARPGENFLTDFLKEEKNNPEFQSLNLDVIPRGALEANREKLEEVLRSKLHELNGWWFVTSDKEVRSACRELAKLLKPLCDFHSSRH